MMIVPTAHLDSAIVADERNIEVGCIGGESECSVEETVG